MRISDWSSDVCSSDLLVSTLASRLLALPRPSKKARNILERRMIFWSAELFVRAAGITAVGLLGAMAASIPASSPARAQDGPVVVNCFDEAHETVKRIPAKDCKGRAISAAEAAEVRKRRQEYIQIGRAACRERGGQYV